MTFDSVQAVSPHKVVEIAIKLCDLRWDLLARFTRKFIFSHEKLFYKRSLTIEGSDTKVFLVLKPGPQFYENIKASDATSW